MAARLREYYRETVRGALMQELGRKNVMNVPKLEKIVVNVGVGDSQTEPRYLEEAMDWLALITGQKGSIRTARRSIAGFKVREGAKIACTVTLRGNRMYEFLDRLLNIAIPRIRDFRGLSPKSFDKQGNYTLGLREQTIFPELDVDSISRVRGMNITFVISNSNSADDSHALLRKFGMPFRG
ncbi:MAG TPA: 50S ribosomal protein L5 [Candidatus Hydrogenedentes bacterium]|nr:50S ribosomal protein L5 [Candidatus Hydrogenedentota bacterium]HQH54215.1 50S ribosomal protein L5 [Candidatus Hydrogenedentota bacterium]HQM49950.1 50S ribosomal protein L5 [Candidatus Hydrogenedentota bacterium]